MNARISSAGTESPRWIRYFTYFTCAATFFLIFAGGLVKSTESGLSVPDWPLSYGMLFPPMVGGVFFEHGHRMIASVVGMLTLGLAISLAFWEPRRWVRTLGWIAFAAVVVQGVLGGITVLFFLPTPVSVAHGIIAQTFFVVLIILAYSQSAEWRQRQNEGGRIDDSKIVQGTAWLIGLIYVQLLAGAVMRHTQSGLAIPDFPTMGGEWWPAFNDGMLQKINYWRFMNGLDDVTIGQVAIHFLHRVMALILLIWLAIINSAAFRKDVTPRVRRSVIWLDLGFLAQVLLGITAVWSIKEPYVTSVHVVFGAGVLGLAVLLFLRARPVLDHDIQI